MREVVDLISEKAGRIWSRKKVNRADVFWGEDTGTENPLLQILDIRIRELRLVQRHARFLAVLNKFYQHALLRCLPVYYQPGIAAGGKSRV